jgi:alpha-galactosidase
MKTIISHWEFGDIYLRYVKDEFGQIGMELAPLSRKGELIEKNCSIEPLVQLHIRGDNFPSAFANGHSMCASQSTANMKFISQENRGNTIITKLANSRGCEVKHILEYRAGCKALNVKVEFVNNSEEEVILEMISSLSFGGLTPFEDGNTPNTMMLHRIRSAWSAEGKVLSQAVEDLQLEPSWANHGIRVEKIGQIGSMPVRKYFPFAAVEDTKRKVTWALQLSCPSSWQIEIRRRDAGLSVTAGLADYDFGHWAKSVKPKECFETPTAYITVGNGGLDEVSQRLLTAHRANYVNNYDRLPVLFNEFCTTWGVPSHENLSKIAATLKGRGIDYLVIDCGWYGNKDYSWAETNGDWIINQEELFPKGLEKTVEAIKEAGMLPGIWFEPETCAIHSQIHGKPEYLLHRNGTPIDTGGRRFLDMRKEEVQEYLKERVIAMLKKYGFKYIKIDYNDSIGVGCDGAESLGEGLRANMLGSQRFYKRIREQIPDISIENCSSGGHRLEPSMMALCDMASFSDAHECKEIPIIAANLHRLILPAQSQIWAVLRGDDSIKRLNYSLVNTMLGVMCLSGDIYNLNDAKWAKVEEGIKFFKKVSHIIKDGVSYFYGCKILSYNNPEGWQAVVRYNEEVSETLVVFHTFGGKLPKSVDIPVNGVEILSTMCSGNNKISLENSILSVEIQDNFEAVAIWIK